MGFKTRHLHVLQGLECRFWAAHGTIELSTIFWDPWALFVCIYLAISDTGLEDLLRLLMDELVPIHHSVPVADSAFVARVLGSQQRRQGSVHYGFMELFCKTAHVVTSIKLLATCGIPSWASHHVAREQKKSDSHGISQKRVLENTNPNHRTLSTKTPKSRINFKKPLSYPCK